MISRFQFFISRLPEHLWIRPLGMCFLSVIVAFLVKTADYGPVPDFVPNISPETIETLLKIIASSMLVIATFAVGSMVSSYASASSTATPRSFALIVADDVSQNALSSFIGAFIFSIVALISVLKGFYQAGGRFALFCVTLLVFALVILMFLRWVDRIARLGRLGTTIDKVEEATAKAFVARRRAPTLGGVRAWPRPAGSRAVYADTVGYVQRVDVPMLQAFAVQAGLRIAVDALPGTFAVPGRPLAFILSQDNAAEQVDTSRIVAAFQIGDDRTFFEDPRFGLVVLSEIAGRALSPAVNDPGTVIDILGTFVRLFVLWNKPVEENQTMPCTCDRVEVPAISVRDMFDDAFRAIARDGAGAVEVGISLQQSLHALVVAGDEDMQEAAKHHARIALARAELALKLPDDLEAIRALNTFAASK